MSSSYPVNDAVSAVFSLLSDPDFIVARSDAIGELEATCEVELQDEKTVLQITRRIARHNVPKMLSRVLNPVQTINFVEYWWPSGHGMVGHYTADIVDLPIVISAQLQLVPTPEGCAYVIEHGAKANILLIGGAVERFIIGQTAEGVGAEIDYLKRRLHPSSAASI
jgi:hypothetical protein